MKIFLVRLKCLLRNKPLLFWTLIFPIIMSTFFKLAFSNLGSTEILKTINVAFVDNETLDQTFYQTSLDLEFSEDTKMFNITLTDIDTANSLLNEGKVLGIVEMKKMDEIYLTVNNGGINQTILKAYLDQYLQTISSTNTIMQYAPNSNPLEIIQALTMSENYLKIKDNGTRTTKNMLNYFYTLIGMALIYGGLWGAEAVNNLQPNLSTHGLRVAISPTKRLKLILAYLGAAFVINFAEVIILIIYMALLLQIDFGNQILYLLIICFMGSITGVLYGSFIALVLKKASEGIKIAVTSLTGIVGGFLSGMMIMNVKYYIQTNIPILQYINPVGVITDALYSLNYYTTYTRFWFNIGILGIMTFIFLVVSTLIFRRDSYESI